MINVKPTPPTDVPTVCNPVLCTQIQNVFGRGRIFCHQNLPTIMLHFQETLGANLDVDGRAGEGEERSKDVPVLRTE